MTVNQSPSPVRRRPASSKRGPAGLQDKTASGPAYAPAGTLSAGPEAARGFTRSAAFKWVNGSADSGGMTTRNAPEHTPDARPTSRRALIFGTAASAATAVIGAAAAPSARAAAGVPLLLGRANDAATGATWITTNAPGIGFGVTHTGPGSAAQFSSTGYTGVAGFTKAAGRWGMHAGNQSGTAGSGGAIRAEGGQNIGLFADTAPGADGVPALVAIGGDGTGTAAVAHGSTYLDGDACLLRAWVGVAGTSGRRLAYAPLTSAERPQHTATGRVTLSAGGTATVTLADSYLGAVDRSTLVVTLTAVGGPMPELYVTYAPSRTAATPGTTGFVVHGAARGTVNWTASAERTPMDLPTVVPAPVTDAPSKLKPIAAPGPSVVGGARAHADRSGRAAVRRARGTDWTPQP